LQDAQEDFHEQLAVSIDTSSAAPMSLRRSDTQYRTSRIAPSFGTVRPAGSEKHS
jgi:hypothetical protein